MDIRVWNSGQRSRLRYKFKSHQHRIMRREENTKQGIQREKRSKELSLGALKCHLLRR